MKRVLVLTVLVWLSSPIAEAFEALPKPPSPSPLMPAPVPVHSPVPSVPALPDRSAPKLWKDGESAGKKPPTIKLGEKQESDKPTYRGAGYITAGATKVKADGNKLTALLTTAAFSHSFWGASSVSVASLQLVQEFEIVPGSPKDKMVVVSLSGKLDGYVRSEKKGTAGLRLADASIAPVGGGPMVWFSLPSSRVSATSLERCERSAKPVQVAVKPGRYVLVGRLVLETTVDGCIRSHAEAVFDPGNHFLGTWSSEDSPRPEVEGKDFGLAITIKVATSPSD
jgi:hypothetical protein